MRGREGQERRCYFLHQKAVALPPDGDSGVGVGWVGTLGRLQREISPFAMATSAPKGPAGWHLCIFQIKLNLSCFCLGAAGINEGLWRRTGIPFLFP